MIIITGAAGFIGSQFAQKCNQEGETDLILVDTLKTSDKWQNLVGLKYAEYWDKNDFLDKVRQNTLPNRISAIVHMGACSATTETDTGFLMENNYRYTRYLAEFALKNNCRFIYASSAATYGNGQQGFDDDESALSSLRPINRYGYSKHIFDLIAKNNGWFDQITGLKFFNVFGPNEAHKGSMKSVVCQAHSQILQTGKLKLFKSYRPDYAHGEQKRDFVYVKDCVDIMWKLLKQPKITGLFNVGTGKAHTFNELAEAVFKALSKPTNIEYIDMPQSIQAHYQYFTEAKMTKLNKCIPEPPTPLGDAVDNYVKNHLNLGVTVSW